MPRALDQAIAFVVFRAKKGWVAPTFILKQIIEDTRAFVDVQLAKNRVVVEFARKLREAKVPDADVLVEGATLLVERNIYPAYQRYAEATDTLLPKSTSVPGFEKFEGGPVLYPDLLRHSTTTELSPEEIHALGVEILSQLEPEAHELLNALGIDHKTLGAGLRKLAEDPRVSFPSFEKGEKMAFEHARELVAKVDETVRPLSGVRPQSGVEVKRVPSFKEESAPFACYTPPALDGSRGGLSS